MQVRVCISCGVLEKANQTKKKEEKTCTNPKSQQQHNHRAGVESTLVITDSSGLCLSQAVSVLVLCTSLSVSLLVAFLNSQSFLCWASYWVLVIALASCLCSPCLVHDTSPLTGMPSYGVAKYSAGYVQIHFHLHKGIGTHSQCSCSNVLSC